MQDDDIIASSVAKLGAAQSTALLESLVARLHLQPQQASRLVPWLRALLLAHGPALAAGPNGQARHAGSLSMGVFARWRGRSRHSCPLLITPCHSFLQAALQFAHQSLKDRTASYDALLALSGRLQVLEAAASSSSGEDGRQVAPKVRTSVGRAVWKFFCPGPWQAHKRPAKHWSLLRLPLSPSMQVVFAYSG